ncbi:hypothetical protein [Dactylosporangium sp. CS-033363]|uniref:hypothetical protein n=1 Tax=Dactylosporangium sp. CS-033363 TaxID=3239935 RepID=UPI003D9171AA
MADAGTDAPPGTTRISSEGTFLSTTAASRHIAALWFFRELDCLVDMARLVALDFVRRPQLYVAVGEEVPAALARLRARYGTDEAVPDAGQRAEVFRAVFGERDTGDFARLRDALVAAAAAFAERVFDTGEEMLRERVRTAHRPFKEYLTGLAGSSLRWSTEVTLTGATRSLAYPILRDPGVCAVFGVAVPPGPQWPFTEDANADKLVEEISNRLADGGPAVTRAEVSSRQRAALRGAEALIAVLGFSEDGGDLDALITTCYTWGSALAAAVPPATAPAFTG